MLKPGGRAVIGFYPKERMDSMGMPADIFTLRAPGDVITRWRKLASRVCGSSGPRRPTPWNVIVATR